MQNQLNKIICGDVVQTINSLDSSNKFDLILADPPYNIGKDFGNNKDNMALDDYLNWCNSWIDGAKRVLKEDGLFYIYGIPEILARVSAMQPLDKQKLLVWHYTNKTTPSSKFWQKSYESILCLWLNERPNLNIDQIREPYSEDYLKFSGKTRTNTKGRFGSKETLYQVNSNGALPRDVIKIPALAGGRGSLERFFMCKTCGNKIYKSTELKSHNEHNIIQHPTQKPLELSKKLMLSILSKNMGKVLIPFSGSGSECLAAKMLGLDFLGIDINQDYVDYGNNLLNTRLI